MFSFKSAAHFFSAVAHDVKVCVEFVAHHQAQIDTAIQTGAAVVSIVDPALAPIATVIDRASEAALGEVLSVVAKATEAEAAHGLNVPLDAAAIAEFKNLVAMIEKLKPGTISKAASIVPLAPAA